jgi:hypothetical protein
MRMAKWGTIAVGGLCLFSLLTSFQNCAQVEFGSEAPGSATTTSLNSPSPDQNTSYAWVSNGWSACSATCGGGQQAQTVVCQRNDGVAVDGTFCTGSKPATAQACNVEACAVDHWVTGGFGACSATCGGGIQTESVTCQDSSGNTVSNNNCTGAAPASAQTCNPQACPPAHTWQLDTTAWFCRTSQCPPACPSSSMAGTGCTAPGTSCIIYTPEGTPGSQKFNCD